VEIFQFDRAEKLIERYGSTGLRARRVAAGDGEVQVMCLTVAAGGFIGAHSAAGSQLFLVIAGECWAAGPDGVRVPVSAGWGAFWAAGETHASGTDTGFTALAIEGAALGLFEPEP
jgi:quercetin dioxygenase-like cupin family protein